MQFETIAVVIFALALLVFMYTRRRVITDLKQEIDQLAQQNEKLRTVALRQRNEIEGLIHTAEQERRARQMATLSSIGSRRPPTTPPPEYKDPDPDLARTRTPRPPPAGRPWPASRKRPPGPTLATPGARL